MKTYISHYRTEQNESKRSGPPKIVFRKKEMFPGEINARGGATVAIIVDDSRKIMAIGVATCSMSDQYIKKIGAHIATYRATAALQEEEERFCPRGIRIRFGGINAISREGGIFPNFITISRSQDQ